MTTRKALSGPLGLLLLIGWFVMGLVETAGAAALLANWFGWKLVVGLPVGFVVAQIPVIGTVAGALGAVVGWDFSWPSTVGLFVGPYAVLGAVFLMNRRKMNRSPKGE